MEPNKDHSNQSTRVAFWENQHIQRLIFLLLLFLVIWVFAQIAYIFQPIATFFQFFAFPIIGTGIFYYLLSPMVIRLSKRGVNRHLSIWIIYIVVTLLLVWGIATIVPIVQRQTTAFIDNLPDYIKSMDQILNRIPFWPDLEEVFPDTAKNVQSIDYNNLYKQFQPIVSSTFGGLGSVIGTVSTVAAGLVTIPILLYYMLLEGYKLLPVITKFIPNKYRQTCKTIFYKSHYQIGRYIRGQIIVAIIVGIMFSIGYTIIGLDYAVSLGVLAMFLNVIPYLGSVISAVPALIIGLITSPFMFVKVAIVLMVENVIEGRFVQPQILGSNLEIHPITILVVLLGAGRLFGLTGVILAVPAYAVLKVIFTELFEIFRKNSSLYQESESSSIPGPDGAQIAEQKQED
ncbi:AI-2E family transporter [Facklamia languida]|uniref:AI-2E family transporter n=1 Tax=Facklamia languida CCUG 37842 TaxID=883113 RepID=H3NK37_9LACT|nr:AI-2E family transporter [Facklamia languida]EHR36554.1 hypothetical protein HMPREF9708_01226 [Facklamia languida CCUG 37842]